jgi:hypothetical protein
MPSSEPDTPSATPLDQSNNANGVNCFDAGPVLLGLTPNAARGAELPPQHATSDGQRIVDSELPPYGSYDPYAHP